MLFLACFVACMAMKAETPKCLAKGESVTGHVILHDLIIALMLIGAHVCLHLPP